MTKYCPVEAFHARLAEEDKKIDDFAFYQGEESENNYSDKITYTSHHDTKERPYIFATWKNYGIYVKLPTIKDDQIPDIGIEWAGNFVVIFKDDKQVLREKRNKTIDELPIELQENIYPVEYAYDKFHKMAQKQK